LTAQTDKWYGATQCFGTGQFKIFSMTPHGQNKKGKYMRIASVKPNDLAVVNDGAFILGIGIITKTARSVIRFCFQ